MSKSNLRLTLEAVEANPQHWDQGDWHCGTSHCFAGFADLLMSDRPISTNVLGYCLTNRGAAIRAWLGIGFDQWEELTDSQNTLGDLRRIVAGIEAEAAPCS